MCACCKPAYAHVPTVCVSVGGCLSVCLDLRERISIRLRVCVCVFGVCAILFPLSALHIEPPQQFLREREQSCQKFKAGPSPGLGKGLLPASSPWDMVPEMSGLGTFPAGCQMRLIIPGHARSQGVTHTHTQSPAVCQGKLCFLYLSLPFEAVM